MEKRYQVFVSSTYEDLQEERREVMQALLKMNCIPTGMELFPAADDDSLTLIQRFIAECDYYIVVVGGRYGSVMPDGRSYTEVEYDVAVEAGIPVLSFLHKEPSTIPAGKTEATDQGKAALTNFRGKIEARRHANYWTSSKDLAGSVCLAMMSLIRLKPRVGWVRGNLVPDENVALEILRLSNTIYTLQKEVSQWASHPPAGSEELAQGEETIELHFEVRDRAGVGTEPYTFTWNEILTLVGPVMLGPATEDRMQRQLEDRVVNRILDEQHIEVSASMRTEEFHRVKIQLKALGLIAPVRGENNVIKPGHWVLTAYGDTLMTRIAAIRSPKAKSSAAMVE